MYVLENHFVSHAQGFFFTKEEVQKAIISLQDLLSPDGIIFFTREMESLRLEKKARTNGNRESVFVNDQYYFIFRDDLDLRKTTLLEIHPAIQGENTMIKIW